MYSTAAPLFFLLNKVTLDASRLRGSEIWLEINVSNSVRVIMSRRKTLNLLSSTESYYLVAKATFQVFKSLRVHFFLETSVFLEDGAESILVKPHMAEMT